MQNLFLLPTNKPSKISYPFDIVKEGRIVYESSFGFPFFDKERNFHHRPHNVYITSDEQYKVGDWFLDVISNTIHQAKQAIGIFNTRKKIILTTDQDLIADGVQAIDDEFLEWFVKNPNSKFVETKAVEFEVDMGLGDECIEHGNYYKIILPEEETKTTPTENPPIKNGDVYDIGQTVNGVSRFLFFNEKWYYFEERISREYEYEQSELTKQVTEENEFNEVKYIGNIFTLNLSKNK